MLLLFLLLVGSSSSSDDYYYSRGYVRQRERSVVASVSLVERSLPTFVDWSQNATTKVKDQGRCGSCWAFSTIQGVESALFLSTGNLVNLSTEELVDCDVRDRGCGGGDIVSASKYLRRRGVASYEDYPDDSSKNGRSQPCLWNDEAVATLDDFQYAVEPCRLGEDCSAANETDLARALAFHGPLSICVNSRGWDSYQSGVFEGQCAPEYGLVNHCVQLVGYDLGNLEEGGPFWKIRNSWGTDWGEDGFIRIPFGRGNKCCVACEAIVIRARLSESPAPRNEEMGILSGELQRVVKRVI